MSVPGSAIEYSTNLIAVHPQNVSLEALMLWVSFFDLVAAISILESHILIVKFRLSFKCTHARNPLSLFQLLSCHLESYLCHSISTNTHHKQLEVHLLKSALQ